MPERELSVTTGAATSALLVAVLVVSSVGSFGTSGAAQPGISGAQLQDADDVDPADEVYVDENGDAVLVYQDDAASGQSMDLGVSVSEGLVHALIQENASGANATGGLTLLLEEDRFTGEGDFQMERPDGLEDLSLDVSGERTSETNRFDAQIDATLAGAGSATGDVESFETNGSLGVTPDAFRTDGEFDVRFASPRDEEFSHDVAVSGTDTGYVVEVTQDHTVDANASDEWETRDAAEETLREEYGKYAEQLDGNSTVTVESHSVSEIAEGEYDLEISYAIEYENVKEGVASALENQLAADDQLDLSRQEAGEIARSVVDLEIRTIEGSVEQSGSSLTGGWTVELGSYEPVVRSGLDVAERQTDDENVTEQIERVRATLDAQRAADLEQNVEWSASATQSDERAEFSAELSSDTENWGAYVGELEDRGIDVAQNDVSMDLSAQTEGGELVADMSMSVEQEDLVRSAVDSIVGSATQQPTDDETQRVLRQLEQSEFEVGKLDVDVGSENVTIEAGAKFNNVSALSRQVEEAYGGHQVSQIVGESGDGNGELHVHVDGLVSEDADESDVRALAVADEDTEVHTGGDWDREFDGMDTERAREFLGIAGEDAEEEDDSSLPGFGLTAAAVALAGAALVARYRD